MVQSDVQILYSWKLYIYIYKQFAPHREPILCHYKKSIHAEWRNNHLFW